MPRLPPRIFVYSKDIENITGRAPRTAQRILQRIKKHYKKEKLDFVTIHEFCEFMRVKEENVREFLTD